ncbi:MAG: hypothetical protein IPK12_04070 [Gemmatimonadetes bacterium]|nr:hypothetical protein [Gemmatimonadota bacterium]
MSLTGGPDAAARDPGHLPVREGRLKPEFAHLYPGIPAGTWMLAATLAKHLLNGMIADGKQAPAINVRLLDDAHFEFRGGRDAARGQRNTRVGDRA